MSELHSKMVKKHETLVLSDEQLKSLADQVGSYIANNLKERISSVETKVDHVDLAMQERTDELEQYGRANNLRIFGIEEKDKEITDKLVVDVATKLGIKDLNVKCISRSHRVGKPNSSKPRPIIVKFVSYADRKLLYEKKKMLKGTGISIGEDLTKTRLQLRQKASEAYNDVWTSDGVVMIKIGKVYHRVKTDRELEKLMVVFPPEASSNGKKE